MRFVCTDTTVPHEVSFAEVMRLLDEPEEQLKRLFLGELIELETCFLEIERDEFTSN